MKEMKFLALFLTFVLLAVSVNAAVPVGPFGGTGWAPCDITGNYGGFADSCWVAWEPVCTEENRDADFAVGVPGMITTMISIDHLNGISNNDGFEIKDGNTILCTVPDVATDTETWSIYNCDVNFVGPKTLTLHPTAVSPWSECNTWGQVAVKSITAASSEIVFSGACTDNTFINGWGIPAIADGVYGGALYNEFCLVWEPTCVPGTEIASVNLAFAGGDELITINHLDGMSNRDSFDVLVDSVVVGHYPDSGISNEDWTTTSFPVNVAPGVHTVTLSVTDAAWDQCDSWGQLAIKSIAVEEVNDPAVPEFGLVGGLIVLVGLIVGATVLRKRD